MKLALAVGATTLQAILVTTSVANQVHGRHRSATAESPAGHGSRGGWNNLNSGYAGGSTTSRSHTHNYPILSVESVLWTMGAFLVTAILDKRRKLNHFWSDPALS
jgi:hypothetical protein